MSRRESTPEPGRDGPVGMLDAFGNAWIRASGHISKSVVEFNRAMLAVSPFVGRRRAHTPQTESPSEDSWSTELEIADPNTITVGDTVRFSKRISDGDVRSFARVSGDTNPLHLDSVFAERSRFNRRIAHGTLVSGVISAALARLPGVTIYLSQDVEFLKPVGVDERVTAVVEVVEDIGEGRYRISTDVVDDDGDPFLVGEAIVLIDDVPD